MLDTDAYAFLNIDHPICAWATYRGVIVCAPSSPGFLSVWAAGLIRGADPGRLSFELAVEQVRAERFSDRVSRLSGMFCLADFESANLALSWDRDGKTHFQPEYLAELSLAATPSRQNRFDANWITYAPLDHMGYPTDLSWIPHYWSGDPHPNSKPIWETLVEGRMTVLGTDIRERAYAAIKSEFPDSLMFLEIARQAALVGSDLGSISAFLQRDGEDIVLKYEMNMAEADDLVFLEKLGGLANNGHPINRADLGPHIEQGDFGRTPDFRPYGFRRPATT
jgi:hypothetical protein